MNEVQYKYMHQKISTGFKSILIIMGLLSLIKFFTGCSDSQVFFHYGYNISKGKVYYKLPLMQPLVHMDNADVASFKVISKENDTTYGDNYSFGTDKNSVYYQGRQIEGSDGPSFQLLQVNYSKDKSQVYYMGWPIPGADPSTFFIKDDNFSGDKDHIFKRTVTLDHDNSVFEIFNEGSLVHTANSVSVSDDIVPIPAGAKFHYLAFNYFALDDQLFFYGKPMEGGDADHFKGIDIFYAKTSKHVYYKNLLIKNADPATFAILDSNYSTYSRDDKHAFFYEKMIEGSDAKTFEVLNKDRECSRDKNAIYFQDKKIKSFTAADFTNKNYCISCDADSVTFAGEAKQ